MTRAIFVLVLATVGCRGSDDECDRAIARLARLDTSKGYPAMSDGAKKRMIDGCRAGTSKHDPVLRCAIESKTDDAAAACIDRVIDGAIKPGGSDVGSGINPLLHND